MPVSLYVLPDRLRGQHGDHSLAKQLLGRTDDGLVIVTELSEETSLQEVFVPFLLKLRASE
jgi:hypothetical protein